MGSPFTSNDFFAIGPSSLPIKIRGGETFPIAISNAAVQCASACAGFILPHWRWLPGCNRASLAFTSSTLAVSKRFFMWKGLPRPLTECFQYLSTPVSSEPLTVSRMGAAPIDSPGGKLFYGGRQYKELEKPKRGTNYRAPARTEATQEGGASPKAVQIRLKPPLLDGLSSLFSVLHKLGLSSGCSLVLVLSKFAVGRGSSCKYSQSLLKLCIYNPFSQSY